MRRFRALHALQLQQLFAGKLSRVGTAVMPPPRHIAGIDVSYVNKDGQVVPLLSVDAQKRAAVVLVGRDKSRHLDCLVLAPELVHQLKALLQGVTTDSIAERHRAKWVAAVNDRNFFASLERRVEYDRSGGKRSFAATPALDILFTVGPYARNRPSQSEAKVERTLGPLVVEITLAATSDEHTSAPRETDGDRS
jgi:hypothetical protein